MFALAEAASLLLAAQNNGVAATRDHFGRMYRELAATLGRIGFGERRELLQGIFSEAREILGEGLQRVDGGLDGGLEEGYDGGFDGGFDPEQHGRREALADAEDARKRAMIADLCARSRSLELSRHKCLSEGTCFNCDARAEVMDEATSPPRLACAKCDHATQMRGVGGYARISFERFCYKRDTGDVPEGGADPGPPPLAAVTVLRANDFIVNGRIVTRVLALPVDGSNFSPCGCGACAWRAHTWDELPGGATVSVTTVEGTFTARLPQRVACPCGEVRDVHSAVTARGAAALTLQSTTTARSSAFVHCGVLDLFIDLHRSLKYGLPVTAFCALLQRRARDVSTPTEASLTLVLCAHRYFTAAAGAGVAPSCSACAAGDHYAMGDAVMKACARHVPARRDELRASSEDVMPSPAASPLVTTLRSLCGVTAVYKKIVPQHLAPTCVGDGGVSSSWAAANVFGQTSLMYAIIGVYLAVCRHNFVLSALPLEASESRLQPILKLLKLVMRGVDAAVPPAPAPAHGGGDTPPPAAAAASVADDSDDATVGTMRSLVPLSPGSDSEVGGAGAAGAEAPAADAAALQQSADAASSPAAGEAEASVSPPPLSAASPPPPASSPAKSSPPAKATPLAASPAASPPPLASPVPVPAATVTLAVDIACLLYALLKALVRRRSTWATELLQEMGFSDFVAVVTIVADAGNVLRINFVVTTPTGARVLVVATLTIDCFHANCHGCRHRFGATATPGVGMVPPHIERLFGELGPRFVHMRNSSIGSFLDYLVAELVAVNEDTNRVAPARAVSDLVHAVTRADDARRAAAAAIGRARALDPAVSDATPAALPRGRRAAPPGAARPAAGALRAATRRAKAQRWLFFLQGAMAAVPLRKGTRGAASAVSAVEAAVLHDALQHRPVAPRGCHVPKPTLESFGAAVADAKAVVSEATRVIDRDHDLLAVTHDDYICTLVRDIRLHCSDYARASRALVDANGDDKQNKHLRSLAAKATLQVQNTLDVLRAAVGRSSSAIIQAWCVPARAAELTAPGADLDMLLPPTGGSGAATLHAVAAAAVARNEFLRRTEDVEFAYRSIAAMPGNFDGAAHAWEEVEARAARALAAGVAVSDAGLVADFAASGVFCPPELATPFTVAKPWIADGALSDGARAALAHVLARAHASAREARKQGERAARVAAAVQLFRASGAAVRFDAGGAAYARRFVAQLLRGELSPADFVRMLCDPTPAADGGGDGAAADAPARADGASDDGGGDDDAAVRALFGADVSFTDDDDDEGDGDANIDGEEDGVDGTSSDGAGGDGDSDDDGDGAA